MKLRKLTREDVEIELRIEDEDIPVRGYALASGDDVADKECEDAIIARLDRGDTWAWCCVFVEVRWHGFSASANLGCCSYEDEADFRQGCYFDSMVDEALDRLNTELAGRFVELKTLVEVDP